MSTIEANTLKPISGSSTLTLGESGDTVSLGTGVTAGTGIGTTINNNADNRVITGSGTANTLEGEANLTYNGTRLGVGGSDLGIGLQVKTGDSGVTSPDTGADDVIIENNNHAGISICTPNNKIGRVFFADPDDSDVGYINYDHSSNLLEVGVNAATVMNIDSGGKVRINTASDLGNTQGVLHVKGKVNNNIARFGAGTNGEGVIFVNPSNTQVGYIQINNSSTVFGTSSDYRLKENAVAISDGITRLKTLKPYRFNFIADNDADGNPTETVDGFFAHEVTAVPEAISGEKDATETYTDDNGDEQTRIKPQAIDQSKLVPLLTSALQEAITKIETLEARVQTLENA